MSGEKTEQPTPRRLRKAREEGRIAKSVDLLSGVVIVVSAWMLLNFNWKGLFEFAQYSFPSYDILSQLVEAKGIALKLILLICAPIVISALIFGILQTGGAIAWKSLKIDATRINPGSRIKQIFSKKNAFELIKMLLKILLFFILFYIFITKIPGELHYFYRIDIKLLPEGFKFILKGFLTPVILTIILLGVIDYFYQRRTLLKDLMMTKEEVKEEFKQDEGNPEIKGRRRQLHQEIAMHNLREAVKGASFVVVNPVHIAVAVSYDQEEMNVPRVTAKGTDSIAKEIIKIAQENGIPVMRNVPLAQALFRVEEGNEIPEELYHAIAELIIQIENNRDKL